MVKNLLKAWLVDNTVTTDNLNDRIAQLETTRNVDLQFVLDEMIRSNPSVPRDTQELAIKNYHQTLQRLILNGYRINTGLFSAVAQLKGVVEKGVWNQLYLRFPYPRQRTARSHRRHHRVHIRR